MQIWVAKAKPDILHAYDITNIILGKDDKEMNEPCKST